LLKNAYNLSARWPVFFSSFSFFWTTSGRPAGAAGDGEWVVLLVLVPREVPTHVRPLLAILDEGEDIEVLERQAGVVAVHAESTTHMQERPAKKY
jgi:hypothetical protein